MTLPECWKSLPREFQILIPLGGASPQNLLVWIWFNLDKLQTLRLFLNDMICIMKEAFGPLVWFSFEIHHIIIYFVGCSIRKIYIINDLPCQWVIVSSTTDSASFLAVSISSPRNNRKHTSVVSCLNSLYGITMSLSSILFNNLEDTTSTSPM